MVDLHCHILPGVDDGSFQMSETMKLLKKARDAGFDTICFTPHYAEPQYVRNKLQNLQVLKNVNAKLKQKNIVMNLFLGNEVFICDRIVELVKNGEILTLANSRYLLIELPMYQELPQEVVRKMIDPLLTKGFRVVVAHPERYTYIQKDPKKILEYLGEDVIFQSNYGSIIGAYGKDAQKTIKQLLKDKIVDYFATDTHHINRCFYEKMPEIQRKLLKMVDEKYFSILTERNPKAIILNREIKQIRREDKKYESFNGNEKSREN